MFLRKMKTPEYEIGEYDFLPIYLILITNALIVYLRIISMVSTDWENKIIENMENMGMKKFYYITSSMTFWAVLYCVYGIIVALILKWLIFNHINFFIIYIIYVTFIICF